MKILIGVALPYANGCLHLGHIAGCYLPADIFARYNRLIGNTVLMVSGSDEHGTPITLTAEKEGIKPQYVVNRYHELNSEILEKMGISFDLFTRTSDVHHHEVTQDFFQTLLKNGYLYKKEMQAFYCENCNRFLPDRYVEGTCPHCHTENVRGDQCEECNKTLEVEELKNPICKICNNEPTLKTTEHFFLSLSKFEGKLLNWLADKDYWRPNVIKFTRNYIKEGLKDRPITRDLEWGVKIPIDGFEDKKIYVWFDAVIGYLSASKKFAKMKNDENIWKEYWKKESKHYYFIGKDNIPFHTMIWPAMLMGHGDLNLPYDVPANEYLRIGGEQFSKSRGVGVWMDEMLERFDPDIIRYYTITNLPEQRDSDFNWEDFYSKVNTDLIDKFGNFVHRVLKFTYNNFGEIPAMNELDDEDKNALKNISQTEQKINDYLKKVELKKAFKQWIELARFGNVYFNNKAPWSLIKTDKKKCETCLHISLKIVDALAILGEPFLPFTTKKILDMLGESEKNTDFKVKDLVVGQKLKEPKILFKKIEPPKEYKNWNSLDLRIAKIENVKDHPDADKLYVLEISLDNEKRTVVAGLKGYYNKEELVGKKVVMLANMEKAKIRGITSDGFLLAADDGEKVSLLIPESDVKEGKKVQANGIISSSNSKISFKKFSKMQIVVDEVSDKINYEVLEIWSNKKCVILKDDDDLVLHIDEVLIILDKSIKIGGKIR